MFLFLDTTDFNKVTFALIGEKTIKKSYKIDPHQSHKTLQRLQEFVKAVRKPQSTIKKIIVCSGPGSYTGVRIGVVTAQALSFAWNIPVFAIEKEKIPAALGDLTAIKLRKKI